MQAQPRMALGARRREGATTIRALHRVLGKVIGMRKGARQAGLVIRQAIIDLTTAGRMSRDAKGETGYDAQVRITETAMVLKWQKLPNHVGYQHWQYTGVPALTGFVGTQSTKQFKIFVKIFPFRFLPTVMSRRRPKHEKFWITPVQAD